jgi:Tfp pilus assembly PilM family ATPase
VLSGSGPELSVLSLERAPLPSGAINENYLSPAIADGEGLAGALGELLQRVPSIKPGRTGLSLPDSLFRVQTFDFDDLPAKAADRERLIRWRFEKSAAFDTSGTVLRYQVLQGQDKGVSLLACIAKRDMIAQFENVLLGLGLDPWLIGPSSFHTLNFFSPYMMKKSAGFALASVIRNSFTTIVVERGGPRFYRFKEIKAGNPGDVRDRLVRELEDSLHFYRHLDRAQPSEVGHLYFTGEQAGLDTVALALKDAASLEVEVLSPDNVLPAGALAGGETSWSAAALGAGGME